MPQPILLIIGYVWPEPTSSAAGCRMMQLIELFTKANYSICFATPAQKSGFEFPLETIGVQAQEILLNSDSFNVFVRNLQPTIVLFDRYMMEEQFGWRVIEEVPNALRILDTEDLHFLRFARQEAYKLGVEPSLKMLQNDLAKREIAAILRCDCTLIISKAEQELLLTHFGVSSNLLLYLPLLFEPNTSQRKGFEDRQDFIFIGNFYHEPNWHAVNVLKKEIWPLIRKQLPNVNLLIYGAYTSEKVKNLHQPKDGFMVEGRAASVFEVMENAKICLAPLYFGAGLKGKLLNAMEAGTPSITTHIGAEGIASKQEWPGAVEDQLSLFATSAIHLYQDQKAWEISQTKGYTILAQTFYRSLFEPIFLQRMQQLQENLQNHREQNFIGAMLQHHLLNSTKYLSKWIQEKNKE
jgi:hypothetical protein